MTPYLSRIISAYLLRRPSHLTFWHEKPEAHQCIQTDVLGPYYMTFGDKARYAGPFDEHGIPLLDYRGIIGKQYYPIAIAQYGLAKINEYHQTKNEPALHAALRQADWLCAHLSENIKGVPVWSSHFDFEYDQKLIAPWYSGLAQGQGISLLLRAWHLTKNELYHTSALKAACSFTIASDEGGVLFVDASGNQWIEEYIVTPPTHILNGFIWTTWGIYDLWLVTRDETWKDMFDACTQTIAHNLSRYDTGWWSLYQLKGRCWLPMLASSFYHRLHIVQLRIHGALTGNKLFTTTADRWELYKKNPLNCLRVFFIKSLFKILYY